MIKRNMTGDGDKLAWKHRLGEARTYPGLHGNRSRDPNYCEGDEGEQQPSKKPRLDVSFLVEEEEDGIFFLRTSVYTESLHDDGKVEESTSECVGECSTCGDVGFQAELFLCSKCRVRLQHSYCSNSYNPRKRWSIGVCNWCEAEVGASRFGSMASKQPLVQGNRRHGERGFGKVEKMTAVDCLLGAALRLPSAGLNVEDILQVEQRCSSSEKRGKPVSFDTVEKARRSGPNCDDAVKSTTRSPTKADPFCAVTLKSSSPSLDNGEQLYHRSSQAPRLKRSLAISEIAVPSYSQPRDAKSERAGDAHADDGKENGKGAGNCDSTEKPQSSTSCEVEEKRRRCYSPRVLSKSKSLRSPRSPARSNDEKSVGTPVNANRTKSPKAFLHVEKSVESPRVRTGSNLTKEITVRRSPTSCPESIESLQASKIVESLGKAVAASNYASIYKFVGTADCGGESDKKRRGSPASDSTGGSDCSNITEQRSARKAPSLQKQTSMKQQQPPGRQLVRPSYIIGKSPRSADDKQANKKCFSNKDSKLRRTSSKISGTHNYKSLSDILC